MGVVISLLILIVAVGTLIAQIASGSAIIGRDRYVDRDERPGQYWFIIGVEALMLLVGVLSTLAFQFGIFV